MTRDRLLRIPLAALLAGLLLGAGASAALAKCEDNNPDPACQAVIANLDIPGSGSLRAGTETTVNIALSRGEQPYDATSVELMLLHVADAEILTFTAHETGVPGEWDTNVTLPSAGTWTVVAIVEGPEQFSMRATLNPLRVRTPLAPPVNQPGNPVNPTNPVSTPAYPWAVLGLAAASIVAIGGTVLVDRRRRRLAPA